MWSKNKVVPTTFRQLDGSRNIACRKNISDYSSQKISTTLVRNIVGYLINFYLIIINTPTTVVWNLINNYLIILIISTTVVGNLINNYLIILIIPTTIVENLINKYLIILIILTIVVGNLINKYLIINKNIHPVII